MGGKPVGIVSKPRHLLQDKPYCQDQDIMTTKVSLSVAGEVSLRSAIYQEQQKGKTACCECSITRCPTKRTDVQKITTILELPRNPSQAAWCGASIGVVPMIAQ
jgi:hypothetical protein